MEKLRGWGIAGHKAETIVQHLVDTRCSVSAMPIERHLARRSAHRLAMYVSSSISSARASSAILSYASSHLAQRGSVYFEINPMEADRYSSLASSFGFRHTDIVTDMYGRKRAGC